MEYCRTQNSSPTNPDPRTEHRDEMVQFRHHGTAPLVITCLFAVFRLGRVRWSVKSFVRRTIPSRVGLTADVFAPGAVTVHIDRPQHVLISLISSRQTRAWDGNMGHPPQDVHSGDSGQEKAYVLLGGIRRMQSHSVFYDFAGQRGGISDFTMVGIPIPPANDRMGLYTL